MVLLPALSNPTVLDYAQGSVYLTQSEEAFSHGLWRLDATTGRIDKLSDQSGTQGFAENGLWFGELNPDDPGPFPPGIGGQPDTLKRLDLATSRNTLWLYRPASNLHFLGLDGSGGAVVLALGTNGQGAPLSELLFMTHPGEVARTFSTTEPFHLVKVIADEHGLWIGSNQGIYFYRPDAGMRKVSDYPGVPANGCH